jgi:parvulin-like peptidyl-prolyl isomerase
MAKNDNNPPFDDYSKKLKKVKLSPDRQNLKPVDPKLTFEQYLSQCIQEGNALLAAEEKTPKNSVKAPGSVKPSVLEDALSKMSSNPYIKARAQVLKKMSPDARSVIEKMEKGELTKDTRWDTFSKAVALLGDKLSENN